MAYVVDSRLGEKEPKQMRLEPTKRAGIEGGGRRAQSNCLDRKQSLN